MTSNHDTSIKLNVDTKNDTNKSPNG